MNICDACGAKNDMTNRYCRDCFVPYEKMSKKNKAALNKSKRTEWNFSPVTRVKPSKKVYNRKAEKLCYEKKKVWNEMM